MTDGWCSGASPGGRKEGGRQLPHRARQGAMAAAPAAAPAPPEAVENGADSEAAEGTALAAPGGETRGEEPGTAAAAAPAAAPPPPKAAVENGVGSEVAEETALTTPASEASGETPDPNAPAAATLAPAASTATPAAPLQPGDLPPGWVAATDPTSGKEYYCHAATNQTTWDKPSAAPAAAAAAAAAVAPGAGLLGDGGAATPAAGALPAGWVATMDPASGREYYYHAVTNQTSWEKPAAMPVGWPAQAAAAVSPQATMETAQAPPASAPAAATLQPQGASSTPAADALPPGWVAATDPASGRVYYCHAATNQTTWDKPAAAINSAAARGAPERV